MTDSEVIDILNEYLSEQTVVNVATTGTDGIWCASVYFGYSEGKLYFSSKTKTKHAKNIGGGSEVGFTIANSNQTPASKIIGIQGVGYCHPSSFNETNKVMKHYGLRFAEYNDTFGNILALKNLISGGLNLPYTIDIRTIKFLHKPRFNGYRLIEFLPDGIKISTP